MLKTFVTLSKTLSLFGILIFIQWSSKSCNASNHREPPAQTISHEHRVIALRQHIVTQAAANPEFMIIRGLAQKRKLIAPVFYEPNNAIITKILNILALYKSTATFLFSDAKMNQPMINEIKRSGHTVLSQSDLISPEYYLIPVDILTTINREIISWSINSFNWSDPEASCEFGDFMLNKVSPGDILVLDGEQYKDRNAEKIQFFTAIFDALDWFDYVPLALPDLLAFSPALDKSRSFNISFR